MQHIRECVRASDEHPSTLTIATIISVARDDKDYNSRTLADALKELRRWEHDIDNYKVRVAN